MTDQEIVREVLDIWRAGIDAHDPDRVAALFTADAIFQGLRPYSVGRDGVRDYYASQPPGLTVRYRILATRRPAEQVVLGYASRFHLRRRVEHRAEPERAPDRHRRGLADRALPGVGGS